MATNYDLWTFRDVLEHVLDIMQGNDRSARNVRIARRAIVAAYSDFTQSRQWKYYQRRLRIATVADQSTGTVAYSHSTREMTLSDATWPSDVVNYSVLINHARYEIESRTSDTVIVLSESMNPGANLSAGTVYRLVRDTYSLPDNFAAMGKLQDTVDPTRIVRDATLQELTEQNRFYYSGLPTSYTIGPHPRLKGGLAIVLAPAPNTARVYEAVYTARPRPLAVELYATGTVTCTAASTAVTGTGTAISSSHVGCVMRFSSNSTNLPTSVIGSFDDIDNPYALQRVIQSVTNAGALVLEQAADQSLSGVRFTISDPIDIENGSMLTAFLRECEYRFATMQPGRQAAEVSRRAADAARAWNEAAERDQRGSPPQNPPYYPWSLPDIAGSVDTTS